MATYVNDLRLKEIGTGESSGTWGSETNVNLELIGEALGFGTEGITTNADTHTTTVADGSTDPGRAMYLKYTGTLDSACTITIAPNTMSRMQFIENGTSGSQNIIISQGTGANVTIPAGDTKAVYLDGAGSGAAVVDAFASLNTVDLKVEDDLTVTDDVSIGGALTLTGNGDFNGDLDVDGTTNLDVVDIDGAVDMATTLAVGGLITVGDGHTIGNDGDDNLVITGSANENVLIDSADDIILDADGADIKFRDGGAGFFTISNSSLDAVLKVDQSNEDMLFKGNDGGSEITALTLDMSAAGHATFNEGIKLSGLNGGTGLAFDLAGSSDYVIKESSTNDIFSFGGQIHHNISSGNVGIGTDTPDNTLHVDASSGGTIKITREGTSTANFLRLECDGSNGSIVTKEAMIFNTFDSEDMRLSDGALIIGRSDLDSNSAKLDVYQNANNKFTGMFRCDGNNVNRFGPAIRCGTDNNSGTNTMLTFQDGDGDGIGTITSSGGTVTYGAFTAHHEVNVPNSDNPSDNSDAYPYGTLVEVVSVYLSEANKRQSIRYTVQKSQSANSKKVLGAYASNMRPSPMCPTTGTYANNLHNISILGDGHIICNNSGGNIEVGDGICTSSTAGIGMKATDNPSMIVGIAQEAVTFSGSETKLVAVQFGVQQFTPWS